MHKTIMLMLNNMTEKQNITLDMAYGVKMRVSYTKTGTINKWAR